LYPRLAPMMPPPMIATEADSFNPENFV
jgi:hypothetical protein